MLLGWWLSERSAQRGSTPPAGEREEPESRSKSRGLGWNIGLALGAITLAGLLTRLSYLEQPIRQDEAFTFLDFVVRPLGFPVVNYQAPNNHVLHSLLMQLSSEVLGSAEWQLRLPALLAGVLLIPLVYLVARQFYAAHPALLAAALAAGASILVEFSTNARGYTLLCLLSVLLFACARQMKQRLYWLDWALFSVLAALGFFTIPTMVFPIGGALAWLLLSYLARDIHPAYGRRFLAYLGGIWLLTAALTLLLYAPILLNSGWQALLANEFVAPQQGFLGELGENLGIALAMWHREIPPPLLVLLLSGLLAALLFHRRISADRVPWIYPVLGWSAFLLLLQRAPAYARTWLFLLPLLLMLAAAGVDLLLRGLGISRLAGFGWVYPWLLALLGGVLCLNVALSHEILQSPETGALIRAEAIAAYLSAELQPGDVVLANLHAAPLEYYLSRLGVSQSEISFHPDYRRLFIVVNNAHGEKLKEVPSAEQAAFIDLSRAELVKNFWTSKIYRVER
jgi:4-amino-4-deoxy-L-arabinose transferase-like glycosyltransferase